MGFEAEKSRRCVLHYRDKQDFVTGGRQENKDRGLVREVGGRAELNCGSKHLCISPSDVQH